MRLAAFLVAVCCAMAGRADAAPPAPPPGPVAIAYAVDAADARGLALILDSRGYGGGVPERSIGIVAVGSSVHVGPLSTINGAVIPPGAKGDVVDATEIALSLLERSSIEQRSLYLIGTMPARDHDRLVARAHADHIDVLDLASAADFDRPGSYTVSFEPVDMTMQTVLVPPLSGACGRGHRHDAPLPAWPGFALLGLATALMVKASRAPRAL